MDREALKRELAELEAKNAAATSWGAAVGARHERIKGIRAALSASHAQCDAAQPVAWRWPLNSKHWVVSSRRPAEELGIEGVEPLFTATRSPAEGASVGADEIRNCYDEYCRQNPNDVTWMTPTGVMIRAILQKFDVRPK